MADQMNIGTLVGYLALDDSGVDKGLRSSTQKIQGFARTGAVEGGKAGQKIGLAAGKGAEDGFGKAEGPLTSKTKAVFGKLAVVAGAAFAADKIVTFFGDTIKQASDLNETVSKSKAIFGAQSDAMMQWAQTSDKAFGLSKASALAAAAQFGDMFSQLGFTGDQAASLSQNVVQLAGDLGSFNNLETGDVLERIAASMRGEYDSLQLLIPNINAARVQQEAMAESGKTNANALTAQEKAAATLAIIQQDGSRAAGDFARTSDQLANSQKIAAAEFANAKAEIGDKLLPVMTDLTHFASDTLIPLLGGVADATGVLVDVVGGVARAYDSLPGPVKAAAAAFVLLEIAKTTGLLGKLSDAVLFARVRFAELGGGMKGLATGAGSLAKSIGPAVGVAAAVGIATAVIDQFQREVHLTDDIVKNHTTVVDSLAEAYRTAGGQITEAVRAKAWDDIKTNFADVVDWAKQNGVAMGTLVDAYLGVSGGADGLRKSLGFLEAQQDAIGGSALDRMNPALQISAKLTGENQEQSERYAAALRSFLSASDDAAQANKDYADAVNVSIKANMAFRDAQDAARDAATSASGAWSNYAAGLSDAARRQDDAKSSALAWATAAQDIPDTFGDMSDEIARFATQTDNASTRLKFFTMQVDELAGRDVSLEEATKLLNDQVRNLREGFEGGTKATKGHIESLINVDGSINTVTEAGSKLYDTVSSYRQAYDAATNAARDHALETGTNADAIKAARAEADKARGAFLDQAKALGISREDAVKMADAMGILEGKKLTAKTLGLYVDDRATPVAERLDSWQPKPHTIKIDADLAAAQAKVDRFTGERGLAAWASGKTPGKATGGAIVGPGTGTSDSILARLSNGEHVLTDDDVDAMGGQAAVYAFRKALHSAPVFAAGGAITGPTSQQLSGLPAVAVGPILGAVQSALADMASTVTETAQAFTDAVMKAKDAKQSVKDLTSAYRDGAADARQRVADVAASAAESVASAKARLAEAKTAKDVAAAQKAVTKAEQDRAKAIDKARAAMEKSTAADLKKLNAAKMAAAAADKEAATAKARAAAVAKLQQESQFLQRTQERLAGQLDATNTALSAATATLANLQQQSDQLRGSVSGKIVGDSSITGLNPLSTVQNVIDALMNRRDQANAISGHLGTLASRGLNGQILQDIAGMGLAGGPLAATLAGASASQLSQINSLQAQIEKAADRSGKSVADAIYANDINLWQTQVDYLSERQAELQDALKANADALATAVDKSLATQTRLTVNQLKVVSGDVRAVRSAVSGLAGSIATSLKASVA